jgi:serine/threonine protein kinase
LQVGAVQSGDVTERDDLEGDAEPPALGAFIEQASPAASLEAHRSLATLEARLFGRRARTVTIGRYVLGDRIASGGGGTVYRARDQELDRDVAIKLLHSGHEANRPEGRARLVREAQLLSRIAHPNIIEIYDVGTYDTDVLGRPMTSEDGDAGVFIAMEYVEGSNLAVWLTERSRPWTEIRDVFVAAGRGLAAAHACGLVHRDFKPANVLVGRCASGTPDVRVLDFGLGLATAAASAAPHAGIAARLRDGLERLGGPIDVSLTMTGAMLGTPAYMAPEQHAAERADERSDQYSFCLAMYEGLYACTPFVAATSEDLEAAKRAGDIMPAPAGARVPVYVEAAVRRGLAPDPAARWADMDALLEALELPPPRRSRVPLLAAAGVASALLLAGGLWWSSGEDDPCVDTLTRIREAWSAPRADEIRDAFMNAGQSHAAETFARVHARLDAYAEELTSTATHGCRATASSPVALQETRACLENAVEQLASTTATLSGADAAVVEQAIDIVARLPPAGSCDATSPKSSVRDARRSLQVATTMAAEGRDEAALEHLAEAHDVLVALAGPPHPVRVEVELVRRELLDRVRPSEDGSEQLRSVLLLSEEIYGEHHPRTAVVRGRLGHALHRSGRHVEAGRSFEDALRDLEAAPRDAHHLPVLWVGLGEARLASGRAEQAIGSFERALLAFESQPVSTTLADAQFGLARALRESGVTEARVNELATRAREVYMAAGDQNAVARVEAWSLAQTP